LVGKGGGGKEAGADRVITIPKRSSTTSESTEVSFVFFHFTASAHLTTLT
jgi:hypothetical protein